MSINYKAVDSTKIATDPNSLTDLSQLKPTAILCDIPPMQCSSSTAVTL